MKKKRLLLIIFSIPLILFGAALCMRIYSKFSVKNIFYKPAAITHKTNVILITVDNLRADALGVYGNYDAKTPHMDALADHGAIFRQCFHPTPQALPNAASLFTGVYPPNHGVRNNSHFKLLGLTVTLPEIFKKNGYKTLAFLGSAQFSKRFGLDQGFDVYEDTFTELDNLQRTYFQNDISAEKLNAKIFKTLAESKNKSPFFLWIQYSDLKAPYSKGKKGKTDDAYEDAVARLDEQLGGLFSFLKQQRLLDDTLFVLVSTKPENLGEHRGKPTGIFPYDVDVKTPLLMAHRGAFGGRHVVDGLSSSVDVAPTLAEMFSFKENVKSDGASLVPLIEKPGQGRRASKSIYLETSIPVTQRLGALCQGVRTEKYKYLRSGLKEELFDLKEDSMELDPALFTEGGKYSQEFEEARSLLEGHAFGTKPTKDAYFGLIFQDPRTNLFFYQLTGLSHDENDFLASFLNPGAAYLSAKDPLSFQKELVASKRMTYGELLGKIRAHLKESPRDIQMRALLGQLLSINPATHEEAVRETFLILKEDLLYPPAYEAIVKQYALANSWDKVENIFRLLSLVYPDSEMPYFQLTAIAFKENKPLEAVDSLVAELAGSSIYKASGFAAGLAHSKIRSKDWPAALHFLDEALKLNPNNLLATQMRGILYSRQGDFDAAVKDFSQVRKTDAFLYQELLYNEVVFHESKEGRSDLAAKYSRLLEKEPKNGFYWPFAQAHIYMNTNDTASAAKILGGMLIKEKDVKKRIFILQSLAEIYLNKKDYKKADAYYQKALLLDPYTPIIANNYAFLLGTQLKKVDEAFKWVYKALSKAPKSPVILDTLAELYYRKGNFLGALKTERDAFKAAPSYKPIPENFQKYRLQMRRARLNQWLLSMPHKNVAEEMLRISKLLTADSKNPALYHALAEIYYLDGDLLPALKTQREAFKLDPKNAAIASRFQRYQKQIRGTHRAALRRTE